MEVGQKVAVYTGGNRRVGTIVKKLYDSDDAFLVRTEDNGIHIRAHVKQLRKIKRQAEVFLVLREDGRPIFGNVREEIAQNWVERRTAYYSGRRFRVVKFRECRE